MILEIFWGKFSEPELQEHISNPWNPLKHRLLGSPAVPKLCEHFPANLQCCRPWKLFTDVGIAGRWVRPPERDFLHDCNVYTKFPWRGWVQAQFAGPALQGRAGRAVTAALCSGGRKTNRCWRSKSHSAAPQWCHLGGTHLLLEGLFSLKEVYRVRGLWWACQEMSKKQSINRAKLWSSYHV